jgi:hypothetical protein
MKIGTVCLVTLTFLAGWQISANGAVIYDESIQGDLPGLNTPAVILAVSAGNNEIVGEVGTYPEMQDTFALDLRRGLRLEAITLHDFGPRNGGQIGFNLLYQNSNSHYAMTVTDTGFDILPSLDLAWDPGYASPIQNALVEIALLNTLNRNFYHLEFDISQVQVPPALWLFGSGLLGLIGIARNRPS